jgi:hypothetical protein
MVSVHHFGFATEYKDEFDRTTVENAHIVFIDALTKQTYHECLQRNTGTSRG